MSFRLTWQEEVSEDASAKSLEELDCVSDYKLLFIIWPWWEIIRETNANNIMLCLSGNCSNELQQTKVIIKPQLFDLSAKTWRESHSTDVIVVTTLRC